MNADGEIDISDVSVLIDYLLAGVNINMTNADCDLDGEVSISDVAMLIDYLLIGSWNP